MDGYRQGTASSHWPFTDGSAPAAAAPHPPAPPWAPATARSFPNLPPSVPMTYTLTMKACLSERPEERPRFKQVATLLSDTAAEVASGEYVNSDGTPTVRPCCLAMPVSMLLFQCCVNVLLMQWFGRPMHMDASEPHA